MIKSVLWLTYFMLVWIISLSGTFILLASFFLDFNNLWEYHKQAFYICPFVLMTQMYLIAVNRVCFYDGLRK